MAGYASLHHLLPVARQQVQAVRENLHQLITGDVPLIGHAPADVQRLFWLLEV
jgi:hypothetical protein